jgi:hypothetical protein
VGDEVVLIGKQGDEEISLRRSLKSAVQTYRMSAKVSKITYLPSLSRMENPINSEPRWGKPHSEKEAGTSFAHCLGQRV